MNRNADGSTPGYSGVALMRAIIAVRSRLNPQSARMPAALTTFAYFSISLRVSVAYSPGMLGRTWNPD